MDTNDMFLWIKENIDSNVYTEKHRTKTGDYLGTKFFITIPNTKRSEPIELIRFADDGLCFMGFAAWVQPKVIQKILLVLKTALTETKE